MAIPIIYGPAYSTYTRTARLALEEKGGAYKLEEVDLFKGETQAPGHLARHPFGKVPAFVHDGFSIYETDAIARYIDEALPGPKLQPSDPKARARMNQIIGVIDSYAYGTIVGKIAIERLVAPMMGRSADEAVVAAAMPVAEKSIAAIEALSSGEGPFLMGAQISLADLFLVPVFGYLMGTPEAAKLLKDAPRLKRWWDNIAKRPSVTKTQPSLG
jgi:glutathione S-transferase